MTAEFALYTLLPWTLAALVAGRRVWIIATLRERRRWVTFASEIVTERDNVQLRKRLLDRAIELADGDWKRGAS